MFTRQPVVLLLCGDVMTGRGVDQILPDPVHPALYEPYIRDAREYVHLAEAAHGTIPRPVEFDYIWGDVLQELASPTTDARIVNLETSITRAEKPWLKEINYRMSPGNIGCLKAAHIDCCCLANNHILDWGSAGLAETIETLDRAGIAHAGAGSSATEAAFPAICPLRGQGRIMVYALGSTSSGIPSIWGASGNQPGIKILTDLSDNTADRLAAEIGKAKQSGDIVVVSIHWGENWGYEIPSAQISFAHRLIDGGVDLVHGHSSHHVKAVEVYRRKLVLYGCGDFITDYEGITGYEQFRGDLGLMYLAQIEPSQGELLALRMVPVQSRRFRLQRALPTDAQWLCRVFNDLGKVFGTEVRIEKDYSLVLTPQ
jgi:poly-gamma-glutamate capsule biosynthesis protein CapA/YwtB (metallophosphatase superfamily)